MICPRSYSYVARELIFQSDQIIFQTDLLIPSKGHTHSTTVWNPGNILLWKTTVSCGEEGKGRKFYKEEEDGRYSTFETHCDFQVDQVMKDRARKAGGD